MNSIEKIINIYIHKHNNWESTEVMVKHEIESMLQTMQNYKWTTSEVDKKKSSGKNEYDQ